MQNTIQNLTHFSLQQQQAIQEQKEALKELLALFDKGERSLVVAGVAGTGKTQLAINLVRQLRMRLYSQQGFGSNQVCGCAAISHNAKNILTERIHSTGMTFVDSHTIASLLNLTRIITNDGEILFLPNKKTDNPFAVIPIENMDIVVIDECSQISDSMMKTINKHRKFNSVIVYLGDWHQTKPIDQTKNDSPTFKLPGVKLVTPFRYEGDIQDLATAVAKVIDSPEILALGTKAFGFLNYFIKETGKDYTFMRDESVFVKSYLKDIKDSYAIRSSILVGYRKEMVTKYNSSLRRVHLNQGITNNLTKFYEGEVIMCKRGVKLPLVVEGKQLSLITSEVYKVIEVQEEEIEVRHIEEDVLDMMILRGGKNQSSDTISYSTIPVYVLTLEDQAGKIYPQVVVLRDDQNLNYLYFKEGLKTIAAKLRDSKLWAKYYQFVHYFNDFDYAYAGNVHIVQGDTYDNVYVNLKDILDVKPTSVREKLQAFYTAITRARKKVVILY